jgi:general secretion pathway protein N
MKWLLGILVLLGALAFAVVKLPLRMVVPYVAPDLTAQEISGSVWDGRLRGAEWRGVALGDLNVALDADELRAGRLRLDFVRESAVRSLSEGGRARLRGRLGTAGTTHLVEQLDGPVSLVLPFPFKPQLDVEFSDAAFLLNNAGKCLVASGGITARLSNIPAIGTTPPMSGTFACDDGALFLPLTTRDGQLGMSVHIWADRRYRADLIVTSQNFPVQLALAAAGFRAGPDGSTLRIEGAF